MYTPDVLNEIINLSLNCDIHAGCKGEASRLICHMVLVSIKFRHFFEFLNTNIQNLKLIFQITLKQIDTEHIILINESLLALNVWIKMNSKSD